MLSYLKSSTNSDSSDEFEDIEEIQKAVKFDQEEFEDFEKESEEENITFNDILESGEKINLSEKRIIYKCKIKYIREAYNNNE